MKTKPRLATCLRVFFNVTYLLSAIVTVCFAIILLLGSLTAWARHGEGRMMIPMLHDVPLVVTDGSTLTSDRTKTSAQDTRVNHLTASVSVNALSRNSDLAAAARWTVLLPTAAFLIGAIMCCRSLRDLCARIEQGEVLSDETLRLVRNIGLFFIAFGLLEFFSVASAQYFLVGYLQHPDTVSGLGASFDTSLSPVRLLSGGLVEGLLILLLSEAFRQGLALKKEAELTV